MSTPVSVIRKSHVCHANSYILYQHLHYHFDHVRRQYHSPFFKSTSISGDYVYSERLFSTTFHLACLLWSSQQSSNPRYLCDFCCFALSTQYLLPAGIINKVCYRGWCHPSLVKIKGLFVILDVGYFQDSKLYQMICFR